MEPKEEWLKNPTTYKDKLEQYSENCSGYMKDNDRFSDNVSAIEMLEDVTTILHSIEYNDKTYIKVGIKNLKEHLSNFEEIFYQNLSNGCYK